MIHILDKKQATENARGNDQILDLTDKDFKVTIIKIFTELKKHI